MLTPIPQSVSMQQSSSLPLLQVVSKLPTSAFFRIPPLQTPHSATSPAVLEDTCLRLGHARLWPRPSMEVLLCPACHRVATTTFLRWPLKPLPLFQLILPPVGGPPRVWQPLLSFNCPPTQECESHTMSSVSLSGPFLVEILTIYPCGYTDRLYQEIVFPSE